MEQIIVNKSICNQRLDKFLKKYLPNASAGFLFKMMRKKNILLNEKKANGNEILKEQDKITIYFSEDTLNKFKISPDTIIDSISQYEYTYQKYENSVSILFEDSNVLILNKPSGLLSQKSEPNDISINEFGLGYLIKTKEITAETLILNKPSICNRLDRNTSGLILFGKTLLGLQTLNKVIKDRSIKKYYRCFLHGLLKHPINLDGFLTKNEKTNSVKIFYHPVKDSSEIKTSITPISYGKNITYAEIELITGKTHQIRAHVASIGHPIIGDYKYGMSNFNQPYKETLSIHTQLLHAYRIEFPQMEKDFHILSEKTIIAPLPITFQKILDLYFK